MDLNPVFKALSSEIRRQILDLLHQRPWTTGELCGRFEGLSRFAVMKHLGILERARLVVVRRQGRVRWNHLNAVPIQQIHERWIRPFEARDATLLLGLKRHVENQKGVEAMPMNPGELPMGSMHIEQEVVIEAGPEAVFAAMTEDVSAWWGRPYVHSDEARALTLEHRVGGRFWEDWGDGAGALYATVTTFQAPTSLSLNGPFGMDGLCHNMVDLTLEACPEGTLVKLSHKAFGEITEERRSQYTAGWDDLLQQRLRALAERGERMGLGHEPPPFSDQ